MAAGMILTGPLYQLYCAAYTGKVAALEAALADGVDPSAPAIASRATALHAACERGHLACVRALLAAGANPDAKDAKRWVPMHYAAEAGAAQCVAALVAAGANAYAEGFHGWCPLHSAIGSGSVETVRAVLEAAPETAKHDLAHGTRSWPTAAAADLAFPQTAAFQRAALFLHFEHSHLAPTGPGGPAASGWVGPLGRCQGRRGLSGSQNRFQRPRGMPVRRAGRPAPRGAARTDATATRASKPQHREGRSLLQGRSCSM